MISEGKLGQCSSGEYTVSKKTSTTATAKIKDTTDMMPLQCFNAAKTRHNKGNLFAFHCSYLPLCAGLSVLEFKVHRSLENTSHPSPWRSPPCPALCGSFPGVHEKLHNLPPPPKMSRVALVRRAGGRQREGDLCKSV